MTSANGKRIEPFHRPVLAREVVKFLVTRPDGIYVDLTCGGGGHLLQISQELSPEALLVGIDQDKKAMEMAQQNLESIPQRLQLLNIRFSALEEMADCMKFNEADGFLLDLGVSSYQIDTPDRGFSFIQDGPLDMRMGNPALNGLTAEKIVNKYSMKELTVLLKKYGEERRALSCAKAIIREREKKPIKTTFQLVDILRPVLPTRELNSSLARIFQALRIEVNDELDQLNRVLPQTLRFLRNGGHLAVISYHSLEDRIVKRFMAEKAKGCVCPPRMPVCACGRKPELKILTKKPVRPSNQEIESNTRARSAKLRAAEKIGQS